VAPKTKRKRRLKGNVPRAFTDHRRAKARRYTAIVNALTGQYGELPESGRMLLRDVARMRTEIPEQEAALDAALDRGRTTEARRIRRSLTSARVLLMRMEERLEATAAAHDQPDLAKALAGFARRANGDGELAE
jgi:hypothetical protein